MRCPIPKRGLPVRRRTLSVITSDLLLLRHIKKRERDTLILRTLNRAVKVCNLIISSLFEVIRSASGERRERVEGSSVRRSDGNLNFCSPALKPFRMLLKLDSADEVIDWCRLGWDNFNIWLPTIEPLFSPQYLRRGLPLLHSPGALLPLCYPLAGDWFHNLRFWVVAYGSLSSITSITGHDFYGKFNLVTYRKIYFGPVGPSA